MGTLTRSKTYIFRVYALQVLRFPPAADSSLSQVLLLISVLSSALDESRCHVLFSLVLSQLKRGGLGLVPVSLSSAHPTDDLPFALERGGAGASAAGWGAA